jgi:type II secretory ATPase GspE/PulE/Tfp pilus assembly ATPase PilB-like protein
MADQDPRDGADRESVRSAVNQLLLFAIQFGAVQIHVDPIAGSLTFLLPPEDEEGKIHNRLVQDILYRMKVMAHIGIVAEPPQAGEIQFENPQLGDIFLTVDTSETSAQTEKLRVIIAH